MLLGYSPDFGRTFSRSAALVADVLNLREVASLSGPPEPGVPYMHQVSEAEYELLIPRRQPEAFWKHPRLPFYQRRFRRAASHLEAGHGPIDVIHGHFYSSVINALGTKWPVVVTEHSSVFGRTEHGGRAVRRSVRMARAVYRRTSMALPVSEHQLSLMRRAGVDGPMRVVPNPTELDIVPVVAKERSEGRIKLLTACRLAPTKNLGALLKVVSLLRRSGLDVSLTLLGEGPERASLERLTRVSGVEEHVTLRGHVTPFEVRREMRAADLYVMSSTVESFGLPVVEAIMSGLPVVATPVGIAPELSGAPSLTLAAGFRPTDILESIRPVIEDYPTIEDRVEGVRVVSSLFSPETIARKLLEIYSLTG